MKERKFYDVSVRKEFYTSNYDIIKRRRMNIAVAKSPYSKRRVYCFVSKGDD